MASSSTSSISTYLQSQNAVSRKELYKQPATALAIFRRMLSHLSKTLVMTMLWTDQPVQRAYIDVWTRPGNSRREMEESIQQLQSLNILLVKRNTRDPQATELVLEEPFASSLRDALTGSGNHNSFGVPIGSLEEDGISMEDLDDYAREQWESILYYVVGSAGSSNNRNFTIGEGSKRLLELGGLVEKAGPVGHSITQRGFTFLLEEVTTQLWTLLITYTETGIDLHMAPIEILSFLFMLGSLEVGLAYSTSTLTVTQRQMLDDLSDLGIVYRSDESPDRFYPTRLALTLNSDSNAFASSLSAELGATTEKGFIVVETNYRIYAYTNSALRIAILSLFMKLGMKYSNMVSGRLTRDSIQGAIQLGITSQQIIDYLNAHAHPIMAAAPRSMASTSAISDEQRRPALPPTVADQIRLWQIEGDRMQATPGHLFKEFESSDIYEASWQYAEEIGVLVWRSDAKRVFFVTDYRGLANFVREKLQARRPANGSRPGTPRQ